MPRSSELSGARKSGGGISFIFDVEGMNKQLNALLGRLSVENISKASLAGLQEFSNLVADDIRQNAPAEHLKKNVSVGKVEMVGYGQYVIRISVNTPDARAWEFGSGIHAKRKSPKTYKIAPKTAKRLVFFWKNKNRWFVGAPGQFIRHPGIKARPYINPALRRQLRHINVIMVKHLRRQLGR